MASLMVCLVLTFTFVVFANSILVNSFAYDDNTHILKNQLIRDVRNIPTLLKTETWFWRYQQDKDPNKQAGPTTPYYRPVFNLVLMLEWHLFRDWAPGWHFGSVLMHLGVVFLVFMLFQKITGDLRLSAISTALFAVHPLRSESVAWICGLTDVLLALLILPSCYLYIVYREHGKRKHLLGSLGFYLLAAFAKEPALALLIFLVAYDLFLANNAKAFRDRIKLAAIGSSGFIAISGLYFVMRHQALGFWLNDNKYVRHDTGEILLTIPLVIWKYLGLLVAPVNLSIFHATSMVKSPLSLRFILPALGLIGLAGALWPLRKSRIVQFGATWFAVNLLPVLNLGAFEESFMIQERYVYVPSIGFSLLIGLALVKLPLERWLPFGSRPAVQTAVALVICAVLAGKAFAQNTVWKDDETLFAHGAEAAPDDLMSHFVLAFFYVRQPDQQPEKVVRAFERYVDLEPNNPVVLGNLAAARLQMYEKTLDRAHVDRAIALCEKSLKLDGTSPEAWDTLGHAYAYDTERKNYERARAYFAQSLRLEPRMALAAFHMGATYVKEGRYDEALPYLDAARQQQPDFPDTYVFLGYAYANTGRIQQGIDSLNEFLKLRPDAQQSPKIEEQVEKLRAMLGQTSGEPGIPEGAVPFGTITVGPSGKPVAPEAPKQ
jgi:tetratricopeptide (TPR) repeat protein